MQYQNVCIESLGYTLPDEVVTSDEIERRLEPLYRRLRLPEGRLEHMTGIRERRFWAPGTLPSDKSVESGNKAMEAVGIDRAYIGALIHASVCRDHLEPATACRVHHLLRLSPQCMIYDVSNACLGLLNGMIQIANMIELGQIRAGLVVGTESGRQLVEHTIESLNAATHLDAAADQDGHRLVDDWLGQLCRAAGRPASQSHAESAGRGHGPHAHAASSAVPQRT